MPLFRIDRLSKNARLCIWQITSSDNNLPVPNGVDLSVFGSLSRQLEKRVTYAMLRVLTGLHDLIIRHEPSGKPLVNGYNISISHTRGWAALVLSKSELVAVDVEYISSRVNKIASRFIREDEQNDNQERRLINWCAKETMYKLLSGEDLEYFSMRLHPFQLIPQGNVYIDDLLTGQVVNVNYEINSSFVLTYALLS